MRRGHDLFAELSALDGEFLQEIKTLSLCFFLALQWNHFAPICLAQGVVVGLGSVFRALIDGLDKSGRRQIAMAFYIMHCSCSRKINDALTGYEEIDVRIFQCGHVRKVLAERAVVQASKVVLRMLDTRLFDESLKSRQQIW